MKYNGLRCPGKRKHNSQILYVAQMKSVPIARKENLNLATKAFASHVFLDNTTTRKVNQYAPNAEQASTKMRGDKKAVCDVLQENTPT